MTENAFVRNFFCPETRRITFESRMHMDLTSGAISFKKYIYIKPNAVVWPVRISNQDSGPFIITWQAFFLHR